MRKPWEVAVLSIFCFTAHAADPPANSSKPTVAPPTQLELLEQMESVQKAMDSLNRLETSLDAMTKARKLKCLKAFGSEGFCECLSKNLAVGLDFEGYIAVITRTKDELKYNALSKEDKGLVDSAINTRTACVK